MRDEAYARAVPSSAAIVEADAHTAAAFVPPPGNPRFPLFDGLRAVAAMSVLLTHASGATNFNSADDIVGPYLARFNAGVAVFFVVSGFLLYRPFVAARLAGTRRPHARGFFRRRRRGIPAYWALLTLLSVWPGLNAAWGPRWWVYYGLVQNLDPEWILGGIGPAWSLCVEVEFYLALPLIALGMDRLLSRRPKRTQMRTELAVIWGFALASLVARTVLHATQPNDTFSYVLPGMLLWFAPGMSLAVLTAAWAGGVPKPRWASFAGAHSAVCWIGAFAVLTVATRVDLPRSAVIFRYTEATWFAEHVLYGAVAALVVAPAALSTNPRGLVERLLAHRVVVFVGLISDSLFLVHLPLVFPLLPRAELVPAAVHRLHRAPHCREPCCRDRQLLPRRTAVPELQGRRRRRSAGPAARCRAGQCWGAGTPRGLSAWARASARWSLVRRPSASQPR